MWLLVSWPVIVARTPRTMILNTQDEISYCRSWVGMAPTACLAPREGEYNEMQFNTHLWILSRFAVSPFIFLRWNTITIDISLTFYTHLPSGLLQSQEMIFFIQLVIDNRSSSMIHILKCIPYWNCFKLCLLHFVEPTLQSRCNTNHLNSINCACISSGQNTRFYTLVWILRITVNKTNHVLRNFIRSLFTSGDRANSRIVFNRNSYLLSRLSIVKWIEVYTVFMLLSTVPFLLSLIARSCMGWRIYIP